jgi:SAM-dependent methyltransferase
MTQSWKDVWAARQLDRTKGSVLERLMAADGLDTGFGSVTESAWREFALRTAVQLDIDRGSRVFEVGCGAGAFLYPLYQRGCEVAGVDQSAALIGYAREAMPEGRWSVGDAEDLDPGDRYDVAAACGVFMYFPDLDYSRRVLAAMVKKAARAIAILDVPDAASKDAALDFRRGSLGEAEYEARYKGLDHLFYDRAWMRDTLRGLGASEVWIEDQRVDGYQNARFRFNAFARI